MAAEIEVWLRIIGKIGILILTGVIFWIALRPSPKKKRDPGFDVVRRDEDSRK